APTPIVQKRPTQPAFSQKAPCPSPPNLGRPPDVQASPQGGSFMPRKAAAGPDQPAPARVGVSRDLRSARGTASATRSQGRYWRIGVGASTVGATLEILRGTEPRRNL